MIRLRLVGSNTWPRIPRTGFAPQDRELLRQARDHARRGEFWIECKCGTVGAFCAARQRPVCARCPEVSE